MALQEKIDKDFLDAYKSHNDELVAVLRLLKSDLKNAEISKKEALSDDDAISVIKRQIKQHKDAIEIYQRSNKTEAQNKEESEIKILELYLPKQLSESDIEQIVKDAISKTNASGPSDMGKVIGVVMNAHKDDADGAIVSKIAKEILSK